MAKSVIKSLVEIFDQVQDQLVINEALASVLQTQPLYYFFFCCKPIYLVCMNRCGSKTGRTYTQPSGHLQAMGVKENAELKSVRNIYLP